jgi:hypothetical protein
MLHFPRGDGVPERTLLRRRRSVKGTPQVNAAQGPPWAGAAINRIVEP